MKKKALAFKAIEMHDPKTGKKVAADFMVTTPNGKKVTAKAYFDELNKFEKHFNTLGHSIRDKEEKVVLSRNRVDAAELEKKAKAIAGSHLRFNAKTMKAAPKRADLPTQFKAKAELDAGRVEAMKKYLAAGPAGNPKTDTVPISHLDDAKGGASGGTVKQWSHELGNRKIIGDSMTARLVTKGGQDNVSVLGSVEADAYLANKQLELLRATASANVGKTGPGKASVTVSIAGRTVYNKALSVNSDAHKADQLSKTFDQGVSFRFSLGPIPMSVKMGASGSMGIRYFVGVRPLSLQAQFVPFRPRQGLRSVRHRRGGGVGRRPGQLAGDRLRDDHRRQPGGQVRLQQRRFPPGTRLRSEQPGNAQGRTGHLRRNWRVDLQEAL